MLFCMKDWPSWTPKSEFKCIAFNRCRLCTNTGGLLLETCKSALRSCGCWKGPVTSVNALQRNLWANAKMWRKQRSRSFWGCVLEGIYTPWVCKSKYIICQLACEVLLYCRYVYIMYHLMWNSVNLPWGQSIYSPQLCWSRWCQHGILQLKSCRFTIRQILRLPPSL